MKKVLLMTLVSSLLGCGESHQPISERPAALDCVSTSNVRVTNVNQAATLAREGCDEIDGDVWVSGDDAIEFSSSVHTIRGTLYIVNFDGLELDLFDRLRSVGHIRVKDSNIGTLQLSGLEAARTIQIEDSGIFEVELPSLSAIEDLSIRECQTLASISTGPLESIRTLHLDRLPALERVDTSIIELSGDLIVEQVGLETLDDFGSVTSVDKTLSVARNSALRDVSGLSSLTTVGATLGFAQNRLLARMDAFGQMTTHDDLLALVDMPGLTRLGSVLSMESIHELELSRLPLITVDEGFSNLQTLTRLRLDTLSPGWTYADLNINVGIEHVTIGNVDTFSSLDGLQLAQNASIYITANDSLTDVSGIQTSDRLDVVWVHSNDIPRLGWSDVTTIYDLRVMNDPDVLEIGLQQLERIENDLEIENLGNLNNSMGLDALTFVGDDFTLRSCGMTSPSFPALTTVDDDLVISGNDNLTSLSGFALNRVGDAATISFNADLAPCEIDSFLASIADGPARVSRRDNDGTGPCN